MKQSRGRPRRNKSNASELTNRERHICVLVARGYTNPECAQRLNVSTRTVDKHIRNIIEKTDSPNRICAIVRLLVDGKLGLNEIRE